MPHVDTVSTPLKPGVGGFLLYMPRKLSKEKQKKKKNFPRDSFPVSLLLLSL
jgi:hypothetical protein